MKYIFANESEANARSAAQSEIEPVSAPLLHKREFFKC